MVRFHIWSCFTWKKVHAPVTFHNLEISISAISTSLLLSIIPLSMGYDSPSDRCNIKPEHICYSCGYHCKGAIKMVQALFFFMLHWFYKSVTFFAESPVIHCRQYRMSIVDNRLFRIRVCCRGSLSLLLKSKVYRAVRAGCCYLYVDRLVILSANRFLRSFGNLLICVMICYSTHSFIIFPDCECKEWFQTFMLWYSGVFLKH